MPLPQLRHRLTFRAQRAWVWGDDPSCALAEVRLQQRHPQAFSAGRMT